jgi:cation diffusion facilitator CzcD-associated flavoprotein CzcO
LPDLIYHSYQPKPYDGRAALVIGAGMAAVTEWVNVLQAGGSVIAVRRRSTLERQPLSAPRCAFGGPWLDRYHRLDRKDRVAILEELGHGTFPQGAAWKRTLEEGVRSGRLQHRVGEIERVQRDGDGCLVTLRHAEGSQICRARMVIAATGFAGGWREYELLRSLVDEYGLETEGHHLILADDCSVPALSQSGSVLAVSGAPARWAYPAADSFAGMKYAARRFAQHAVGSEGHRWPRPAAWYVMIRGGWPYGAAEVWEPCATP